LINQLRVQELGNKDVAMAAGLLLSDVDI
jgi:hypothetical protein